VAELPIRPLAGPPESSIPKAGSGNFRPNINAFKELIRGFNDPKLASVSATGPGISGPISDLASAVDRPTRRAIAATADPGDSPGTRMPADSREMERAQPATALDPFAVLLGSLGAFDAPAAESRAAPLPEQLASEIVRTIAWGGDRRRGAARIELGGERFGGTKVTVEVDGDRLRLGLDAPPGVDSFELRQRLTARLERRGLSVEEA
jgi:hypothetical protein